MHKNSLPVVWQFIVYGLVNLKILWFISLVCILLNFVQEYGIRGFPTIKVFVPGKPPVDYQGARDVKPIAEFALQQVQPNLL